MRIERTDAVGLVIDYQEKLVPAMNEKEQLIQNTRILLEGLKILDVPMILTQQYTKGLGMTTETITEAVGHTEYVDKIRFSAYEDVKEQIQGKRFVIVCGMESHICVLQTVIELKEAGFIPVLVTDCIASRKEKDKEMALIRAQQEGAILTTYEAVLFELLKAAGTETSKKIQKLIR